MLLDQDLPWLLAEARNDPATAQRIIEAFAERVQSLQRQMDELRAENALLKRAGGLQASNELTQRYKTNLRDLRQLAERHQLNRDIVTLMSFTGHAMQWPAPGPIEQTLPLATPPDEPVRDLKPVFLAAGARFGSVLAVTSSARFGLAFGLSLPLSENVDWRDARPAAALGLARAGVPAARIDHVIRTGGSSAIPYFVTMLANMFGRDKVAEADRFTSVAAGLAVRAGLTER